MIFHAGLVAFLPLPRCKCQAMRSSSLWGESNRKSGEFQQYTVWMHGVRQNMHLGALWRGCQGAGDSYVVLPPGALTAHDKLFFGLTLGSSFRDRKALS